MRRSMPPYRARTKSTVRSRGRWSLMVGVAIAWSSMWIGRGHAQEPRDETASPPTVPTELASTGPLRVRVDPAITDAELIPGWLVERHPELGTHLRSSSGRERWVAVEVNGALYDYRITVVIMENGEPLVTGSDAIVCECSNDDLFDEVDEEIERLLEELPPERPTVEDHGDDPVVVADPCDGRRPCWTRMGHAGVGVTASGGAIAIGGLVMVLVGRRALADRSAFDEDWRPPGLAALGVGGAALAVGAAVLAIDLARCAKDPVTRRCGSSRPRDRGPELSRRLSAGPWMSRTGAGAALGGRF